MGDPATPRADLSTWRTTPFSRWGFQHVDELIPVATISARPGAPLALPQAPQNFEAFRLRHPNAGVLDFEGFLEEISIDALVVLHDGAITTELYEHGMTPASRHIVMSASKSIVGLVAGLLERQSGFELDARVSDFVPEIAATAYRGATLRQLLDMRAGVVLSDEDARAYAAATGWDPNPTVAPLEGLHDFFPTLRAAYRPHGGPFRYVSANTDLLGWAMERAAGRSFAQLMSDLLWRPMGAEADAAITLDPSGAPRCTGGLLMTARDFARIGEMLVRADGDDRPSVVPKAWIQDVCVNGDRRAWKEGDYAAAFGGLTMSYRSGWYVVDDQPQMIFAMGIHGQNLFVDLANRLVIAMLSSQGAPVDPRAVGIAQRAVREMRRCLLGTNP